LVLHVEPVAKRTGGFVVVDVEHEDFAFDLVESVLPVLSQYPAGGYEACL